MSAQIHIDNINQRIAKYEAAITHYIKTGEDGDTKNPIQENEVDSNALYKLACKGDRLAIAWFKKSEA